MAKAIADLESLRNAEYQEHQQKTRAALQVTPKVNAMSNVVVTDPAAIEILKNAPQFKYGHKIRNGVYEVSNDRLELLLEAVKSQKAQSRPKFR